MVVSKREGLVHEYSEPFVVALRPRMIFLVEDAFTVVADGYRAHSRACFNIQYT